MNDKTQPAAEQMPKRSYPRLCERTGRIYYSAEQEQAARRERDEKAVRKKAAKKRPVPKK